MYRRQFLLKSAVLTLAATNLRCSSATSLTGPEEASSKKKKHRVAIIGCGRMGQYYAEVYRAMPDTELVAIAEWNPERRKVVGERFGVKALYRDVNSLLKDTVPDIAAVVTPSKYMKEAVIACAQSGVKGISTDKPIAAKLADADAMVDACKKSGTVFAGGNLQRAKWDVQEAARRLHSGEWGKTIGTSVHGFGGEISGGGCQHLSILRLFTKTEVDEVIAWGSPLEALAPEKDDAGLIINGLFKLNSGLKTSVFGKKTPYSGVDYLISSIRSFIDAVEKGTELFISGHDLRQALEIAIACKLSAQLGNRPVKLPLQDRSLTLYPRPYRWLGGDVTNRPQSPEAAAGKKS